VAAGTPHNFLRAAPLAVFDIDNCRPPVIAAFVARGRGSAFLEVIARLLEESEWMMIIFPAFPTFFLSEWQSFA
jgi:hypothetical protein